MWARPPTHGIMTTGGELAALGPPETTVPETGELDAAAADELAAEAAERERRAGEAAGKEEAAAAAPTSAEDDEAAANDDERGPAGAGANRVTTPFVRDATRRQPEQS